LDKGVTEQPTDVAQAARVVLVSNRLPVSVKFGEGIELMPSSGGLVTGMRGLHGRDENLWIGWPGAEPPNDELRAQLDQKLAERNTLAVHLAEPEASRFYEGISNGVIWPLFHYLIDRIPLVVRDWDAYVSANQHFAEKAAEHAREGDLIWIHDYHLLLVPGMLRARMPRARIGFFLHVPFPSSEIFRILPNREQVLRGLLGADLIGFHTFGYRRHFSASLLSTLGIESELDHVDIEGRSVRLGVFPMGIDAAAFSELGSDPATLEAAAQLRPGTVGQKLLVGVDRLDYTKGLPRRLLALERLFERTPRYRDQLRFLQIAVPTREGGSEYKSLRREVEELVGRINGAYGSLHGTPIQYLYQGVTQAELVASYRAADVMVVTPLRDGMNLVAKEFVATRADGDGVLVLSEFAGAASELGEALRVNPYDVEQVAAGLAQALDMSERERRERMSSLRQRVLSRPVEYWARSFLDTLAETPDRFVPNDIRRQPAKLERMARQLAEQPRLLFALDYDGTLEPIRWSAESARPDLELEKLLTDLSGAPGTTVYVVSGRLKDFIERWLGAFPIGLVAEHGIWTRQAGESWQCHADGNAGSWKPSVRTILDEYTARAPGAFVEDKTAGLAWHYRRTDPYLGAHLARELRLHLVQALAQQPVNILAGRKLIEIRAQGIDKGVGVRDFLGLLPDVPVVAIGDDRTDEDLFSALPASSITLCAGTGLTRASYRVDGPSEVRWLLGRYLALRAGANSSLDE
jgi:trehalose 6-phosphate synthase/phosphatase